MLGIFMWIQFILFYVLSLPFNVACQSKDVVLEGQYALPGVSIEIKPGKWAMM